MTPKLTTLIAESDEEDRAFLRETLEETCHSLTAAATVSQALDRLRNNRFDVVIAALELEGSDGGLRVARAVRWRWPRTSVIIVAEKGTPYSATAVLTTDIDGYLLKPVSAAELRGSVRRAVERQEARRGAGTASNTIRWKGLVLDRKKGEVTRDGEPIHLTPTEFRMLAHLMENRHRVVSSAELFEVSCGRPTDDSHKADDTIRWHIHNLRRKVEPHPSRDTYVVNVYGRGYRFGGAQE